MSHLKSENCIYGQAFEIAVAKQLGVGDTPKLSTSISSSERAQLLSDAKRVATKIQHIYGHRSFKYVANAVHRSLGNIQCDDGSSIELKYVASGSGTYHNTSISYLDGLGVVPYRSYLKQNGYYDYARRIIPADIPLDNGSSCSLVSMENSHVIRKKYPEIYKPLRRYERKIRVMYTEYIANHINENKLSRQVLNDMLGKRCTAGRAKKGIPNHLIVYNYRKKTMRILPRREIDVLAEENNTLAKDECVAEARGTSIRLGGIIRLSLGWQNGNGLCNPTIRVFLL